MSAQPPRYLSDAQSPSPTKEVSLVAQLRLVLPLASIHLLHSAGIIDRKNSAILPIFLQAKIPKHFQNYGDDDSEDFRPPKLPKNYDSSTESEKEIGEELYRRRQLHYFYLESTSHNNEPRLKAMGRYELVVRSKLYDTAGRPWEGDNNSLKAELIQTSAYRPGIATSAMKHAEYPVEYYEAEVKECLDIDEKQKDADSQVQKLRGFIDIKIDGWVPAGHYDEAKEK
jgi:hypothetical protein